MCKMRGKRRGERGEAGKGVRGEEGEEGTGINEGRETGRREQGKRRE